MGADTAGPREVEGDVLMCPRLDIQRRELETDVIVAKS
jgi:hypothetical protein